MPCSLVSCRHLAIKSGVALHFRLRPEYDQQRFYRKILDSQAIHLIGKEKIGELANFLLNSEKSYFEANDRVYVGLLNDAARRTKIMKAWIDETDANNNNDNLRIFSAALGYDGEEADTFAKTALERLTMSGNNYYSHSVINEAKPSWARLKKISVERREKYMAMICHHESRFQQIFMLHIGAAIRNTPQFEKFTDQLNGKSTIKPVLDSMLLLLDAPADNVDINVLQIRLLGCLKLARTADFFNSTVLQIAELVFDRSDLSFQSTIIKALIDEKSSDKYYPLATRLLMKLRHTSVYSALFDLLVQLESSVVATELKNALVLNFRDCSAAK